MFVFKTSSETIDSVVRNEKHAFWGMPQEWDVNERVLISKNKAEVEKDEKQIQFITKIQAIRPLQPGEVDRYWPGNSGRWKYLVELAGTERIRTAFNLVDVLGVDAKRYDSVVTYARLLAADEARVSEYLKGVGTFSTPNWAMNELLQELRDFNRERDWERFHTPKSLAMGLSIEAAELMELFLWKSNEQSTILSSGELARVEEEIGDVYLFLLNIADKFDLDPINCARRKLTLNQEKYPADLVRGSAKKYDEYSAPTTTSEDAHT